MKPAGFFRWINAASRRHHRRLALELLEDRSLLTTLVVNTTDDVLDVSSMSLRRAIVIANTISGPDEIIVPEGVYRLARDVSLDFPDDGVGLNGDLDIIGDVRIIGAGATSTTIEPWVDAFDVHSGRAEISNLMIGGAIQNSGTLSVADCVTAFILNDGALTVTNTRSVGGIHNGGVLDVVNSVIVRGGLFNALDGTAAVRNSTIAGSDVGIQNLGNVVLEGTTLVGNGFELHLLDGGAIYNGGQGSLRIVNSTITNNRGDKAIRNDGALSLINATIANNQVRIGIDNSASGTVNLINTIVSNPGPRSFGQFDLDNHEGTILVALNNLILRPTESAIEFFGPTSGNIVGVDPMLSGLGDFGGPTSVHAPLPGSPVIDAGTRFFAPATDQRGVSRPQDGDFDGTPAVDIGAVELWFPRIAYPLAPAAHLVLQFDDPYLELTDAQSGKVLLKEPLHPQGSINLVGSQADDNVTIVADGLGGYPISFAGREGNDTLTVQLRTPPPGTTPPTNPPTHPPLPPASPVPVSFDGGSGADSFQLTGRDVPDEIRIEGRQEQAPQPRFNIAVRDIATNVFTAQLSAVHAEVLRIHSGGGDDNIGMKITGGPYSAPLTVEVDAGGGDDKLSIDIDAVFESLDFDLDLGKGHNETFIRWVDAFLSTPPRKTSTIHTRYISGNGHDLFEASYQGPLEVIFDLEAHTGGGDDDVDIQIQPRARQPGQPPPNPGDNPQEPAQPPPLPDAVFNVAVSTGVGADDVSVSASFDPAPCFIVWNAGIDLGAGDDRLILDTFSGADFLTMNTFIQGDAGDDDVSVNATFAPAPCFIVWNAAIDLGAGADRFTLDVLSADEAVELRLLVRGAGGSDTISAQFNVKPKSPSSLAVLLEGGSGDDDLTLAILADLALVDLLAILDGEKGFDIAHATSNVLVKNIEQFTPIGQ